MTKQQTIFFEELSYIQEYCVNVALCNKTISMMKNAYEM